MMLNLEWLRTFKAIYENGTLTGAAQSLYISQPGVSLHLSALEGYTGYKLFDRSAKRMVPTEGGKVLYNFVLEPLEKLDIAQQLFHKSSKAERATISVGMCFETFQFTLEKHISSLSFNVIVKFGEYPQMQQDLDKGLLDLIIIPQKGLQKNLEYMPFSKEQIVMINGNKTDTKTLKSLLKRKDLTEAKDWLRRQIWYSTTADMEHLKNFWKSNFNEHPDFKPNYIVPNIGSIIRCLSDGEGFAIVPDYLCRQAIADQKIHLVWEGRKLIENTLYFGTRKKTIYEQQINEIKRIFEMRPCL